MENNYSEDIGEEIISRLKELNNILEKMMRNRYERERPHTPSVGNNISELLKERSQ